MAAVDDADDHELKSYLKQFETLLIDVRKDLFPTKPAKPPKSADQAKIQKTFDENFDQVFQNGVKNLKDPYRNAFIKLGRDLQIEEKRRNPYTANVLDEILKQITTIKEVLEGFRAAWEGNLKVVENFVKKHPEWKDQSGIHDTTLLYGAARNNHFPIVQFLIEKAHCSINAENKEYCPSESKSNQPRIGSTALHVACYMGNIDLVKYLTEHGADYFKLNSFGETPLMNGHKKAKICRFFSEFLLLGYTKADERLATRSAWEETLKSKTVIDAIWEYQSPNDFQWLQFSLKESDELQQILLQQIQSDQPFQSIVQLRGTENLYSISLEQFSRLGRDRFSKNKTNWIRCRASPLKNFALFTNWQMMFTRYPKSTDDQSNYLEINLLPKKLSSLKLHSWYQLDSKTNLQIERAMNYRRRYISLLLPNLSSTKIFFNFETFFFFNGDHSIEGFLRWIPKLILDDSKKFQLIDNFQDDEKRSKYRPLTQRHFLHLSEKNILSDDEKNQHNLQSIDFDDRTEDDDRQIFSSMSLKTKTSIWDSIEIESKSLFDMPCDVIVVPITSPTLKSLTKRFHGNPLEKVIDSMEKGEITDYLKSCPMTNVEFKCLYFVQWKDDKDRTKALQSIEELVKQTMSTARDENYTSIAYPTLNCKESKMPMFDVSYAMLKEIHQELNIAPLQVHLCVIPGNKEKLRAYHEALAKLKKEQEERDNQPISIEFGHGALMRVVKGDLTEQQTDVIATSSSSENLTQILLNAAGKDIADDFNQQQKVNPNLLVIVTPSGNLKCKKIFFLKWAPTRDDELLKQSIEDLIHNLVQNLLSYNFKSIAFPAIGAGEYGFNINVLIKTIVKSFREQLIKRKLPWSIQFVIQPHQQQIFDEFSRQIIASNQSDVKVGAYALPSNWTKTSGGEKRVPLDLSTSECQEIINRFNETMKGTYKSIVRIERIQNERWYMQYLAHAKDFQERLQNNTEKLLFHGCPEDAAYQISEDCFNRSFAGKNGTVYGFGVYFTSNASYSNSYTKVNGKGERCMFLAQVLVGKTTIGNSSMKVRPVGFDSTTDGKHITVTYHDAQAYAKYLIFYK